MAFAGEATAAAILVLLTLLIQTTGMATLIEWIRTRHTKGIYPLGVLGACFMMVQFTVAIFVLHLLAILPWAGFYRWRCCLSWEAAWYFSACSYSTVGYGDVVLPQAWRSLGPIESVTGVLMCGLSTALLFAIVLGLVEGKITRSTNSHYDR
jgi:voltage-gated potassium channel